MVGGDIQRVKVWVFIVFLSMHLFFFCINKRGDAWHFFFCVFMFDESRLYKILLFPFYLFFWGWGVEGTRSMMPREAYEEKIEL